MLEMKEVGFLICPWGFSKAVLRRFQNLIRIILRIFKFLPDALKKADINLNAEEYLANVIGSCLIYFVFFSFLLFAIFYFIRELVLSKAVAYGGLLGLVVGFLVFALALFYPRIIARKKGEKVERSLVFALKDLLLQLESGASVHKAFYVLSKSGYGELSKEFGRAVKEINKGVSVASALRNISERVDSDYLKKTTWQVTNSMVAGTSFKIALRNIIKDLILEQQYKIKNYAQELNMWSLVYMLVAVALPTIGVTLLIILSIFAGFGITQEMFFLFLAITFVIQFLIIGIVKSRRPLVDY